MKKKIIITLSVICMIFILAYASVIKMHTITLSNRDNLIKSEQIQPVFSYVTVSGDMDTDVILPIQKQGKIIRLDILLKV